MEIDTTSTSEHIILVNEVGKIVKDQELLRSLTVLLQKLEPVGHGEFTSSLTVPRDALL